MVVIEKSLIMRAFCFFGKADYLVNLAPANGLVSINSFAVRLIASIFPTAYAKSVTKLYGPLIKYFVLTQNRGSTK
jgi:hypothetical protein